MILVIDTNSLGSRSFYTGINTFFGMVEKAIADTNADTVVFAFDHAKNYRREAYPRYKANRDRGDGYVARMAYLRNLYLALLKTGHNVVCIEGYEADDILASYVWMHDVTIMSGDKDLWGMCEYADVLYFPKSFNDRFFVRPDHVREKYGVEPTQIVTFKALAGENSDKIPGVKGIGEVAARELIQQYNDLGTIYHNIAEIKPNITKKLIAGQDDAYLSYTLAKLNYDAPVPTDLSTTINLDAARRLLWQLQSQ